MIDLGIVRMDPSRRQRDTSGRNGIGGSFGLRNSVRVLFLGLLFQSVWFGVALGETAPAAKEVHEVLAGFRTPDRKDKVTVSLYRAGPFHVPGSPYFGRVEVRDENGDLLWHEEDFRIEYSGTCRSTVTGRTQLVFYRWSGAGGETGQSVFVYYDEGLGGFQEHAEDLDGDDERASDRKGPPCAWEGPFSREEEGRRIYAALSPTGRPFDPDGLEGRPDSGAWPLPRKRLSHADVERTTAAIEGIGDDRFFTDVLVENKAWTILGVYFEEPNRSWGVLLARKNEGTDPPWTAFFDLCPSDHVLLHHPRNVRLRPGGWLSADFCFTPHGWLYDTYRIDFDRMTLSRTP